MRTKWLKLALDRCKIIKDVGVIKLQIVQHGGARAVMHKFAALVEKAVSYSSASMTNSGALPRARCRVRDAWRPGAQKHQNPAARHPPENPAPDRLYSRIQASMDVVVVLPYVPATANVAPCKHARPATAARWYRDYRRPGWLPSGKLGVAIGPAGRGRPHLPTRNIGGAAPSGRRRSLRSVRCRARNWSLMGG